MKTVSILLNTIDKINDFVKIAGKIDEELDLVSDRYVINGKSIMGIFSLNLSKPVQLKIYAEGSRLDEILGLMEKFIVKL
ncbi:MAG: Phosphocarrier protein HPr [Lachnoclostridium sp.]